MQLQNKTVFIETYGCAANQNNSEIIAGLLSRAGFMITSNEDIAEIIILNTCIVKSKTESKILRRIQDLKKQKNKLLIIAGCMPETEAKNIKKLNPEVLFLGTHHTKEILNLIRDYQDNKLDWKKQEDYLNNTNELKLNLPKKPLNNLISIHQISEGCLGNCTYCKTKLAKGKLFSYPKDEIIKSIESDLQNGAKEIWLTSQDCASYGLDKNKHELGNLLKSILSLKHKFKLRLGMMNPNNVAPLLKELIEIYKDKKMYKFIHIPIQSASNTILEDMNRPYKIASVEKIISEFKKEFPQVTIATDIITGYPTEKEEDHQANLKFIEEFRPDVLNISKFSSHKGTAAGRLNILDGQIMAKRAGELMALHRKTAEENKQQYENKTLSVFINKKISDSLYEARDENYAIILLKGDKSLLGKEVNVKITQVGVHHLIGEL